MLKYIFARHLDPLHELVFIDCALKCLGVLVSKRSSCLAVPSPCLADPFPENQANA